MGCWKLPLKLVGRLYEAGVPKPAGMLMDAVPNVAAGKQKKNVQFTARNNFFHETNYSNAH